MAQHLDDWQLSCTEIKQRGHYLLQSGQWSDCTFLVGSESNQVIVHGHKLLLAMASPVFEAMFFGGMAERNDPIRILDVQPDAFKALLEYIYTDIINISSFDKACELCYGAKKYMLPFLVKECTRYLWADLYPRNACRAYEFARLFDESVLMDKCIQIITTNTKEVLQDSSFEDVELNTVMTVFSLDHLNIDSELDLFNAAVKYAKAQEKLNMDKSIIKCISGDKLRRKSPEPSTSKVVVNIESSAENSPEVVIEPCKSIEPEQSTDQPVISDPLPCDHPPAEQPTASPNPELEPKKVCHKSKVSIRSAIEKIRFLTLTPQQFAEGPARSNLLTESEAFAVLMNILSSNSDVPMPHGFSTCRVPRKQLIGESNPCQLPTFTVDTPSPVTVDQVFHDTRDRCAMQPSFSVINRIDYNDVALRPSLVQIPEIPELRERAEFHRIYCQRTLIHRTDCLNASILDCTLSFTVDKNICLLGVQVPTQTPREPGAAPSGVEAPYSELLYAYLLDADGARLTYTHYTSRVPFRHLLDIMFNRPVYIQRHKLYRVGVVFNKIGWYPMGTCMQQVTAESVNFTFGVGQSSDSVREGLIRSIIFTY